MANLVTVLPHRLEGVVVGSVGASASIRAFPQLSVLGQRFGNGNLHLRWQDEEQLELAHGVARFQTVTLPVAQGEAPVVQVGCVERVSLGSQGDAWSASASSW